MNTEYEKPVLDFFMFDNIDVITSSGETGESESDGDDW